MIQIALSKVTQVLQQQIRLCTTPGYNKRQHYFKFAMIVSSLDVVNWLISYIQIRKCQTIDWLFSWAVSIKTLLHCTAGLQGTFSKTQMTCRQWLSLSGLEIVSEVRTLGALTLYIRRKFYQNTLLARTCTWKIIIILHEQICVLNSANILKTWLCPLMFNKAF